MGQSCVCVSNARFFLGGGLVHENYWARSPELFRFREHVESIESFERDFVEAGFVGSLYLPHEIPYWGPVLESAGGVLHSPEAGILDGLNAESDADGIAQTWLGSFQVLDAPDRMGHALWGQLTYTGTELSRICLSMEPAGSCSPVSCFIRMRGLWIV